MLERCWNGVKNVMTVESWCTQSLRALPGTPSGPAALQGFIFCSVFLTLAGVMLRGESSSQILNLVVVLVFELSFVRPSSGCIHSVECIVTSGSNSDMLMEHGESVLQVHMVKITCSHIQSLSVLLE